MKCCERTNGSGLSFWSRCCFWITYRHCFVPICKVPWCHFKDEATEDILPHRSNSALSIRGSGEIVLTMLQGWRRVRGTLFSSWGKLTFRHTPLIFEWVWFHCCQTPQTRKLHSDGEQLVRVCKITSPPHLSSPVGASGNSGLAFFLSEAMECFICVFAWLSETLHLQHNYRTASLGSLTPSFISQHHLTIFAPHWWAKEVGWCSVIRKKKVSEETARESESVFRMFRFSHTVWLQYSVRV